VAVSDPLSQLECPFGGIQNPSFLAAPFRQDPRASVRKAAISAVEKIASNNTALQSVLISGHLYTKKLSSFGYCKLPCTCCALENLHL